MKIEKTALSLEEEKALELEEKKKKARQKEQIEGENYMIAAGLEKKTADNIMYQKKKEKFEKSLDPKLKKNLANLYADSKKIHEAMIAHDKRLKELYKFDSKTLNKAGELNLSENNVRTISLCSNTKNKEKLYSYLNGEEQLSDAEKAEFEKEGSLNADKAIEEIKNKEYQRIGKEMGNSLKDFCKKFAESKSKEKAAMWSSSVEDILDVLRKKPELLKETGLKKEDFEKAKEVAKYGKVIKEGVQAIETLAKNALLDGPSMDDATKQKLTADITNMQVVLYSKENLFKENKVEQPVIQSGGLK